MYKRTTRSQNNSNKNITPSPHDTLPHLTKSQTFNYSITDSDWSIGVKNKIGTKLLTSNLQNPWSTNPKISPDHAARQIQQPKQ
jgi:hypothetical protein